MLRSRLLQLRALEKVDLPFLHRLHNNHRSMNYFFEEPYETLRELEDLYEKYVHNTSERRFILQSSESSGAVGVLSLIEIDEINRRCEMDIIIDDKYQGHGYGKGGFILGVKYAFDILNLFKAYLLVLPTNLIARRIYESIGFRFESRLKKEYFVNGQYVDAIRMCMFEKDWKKRRPELQRLVGFDEPTNYPYPTIEDHAKVASNM